MKQLFNKIKYYLLAAFGALVIAKILIKFAPIISKNVNFVIALPIAFILMILTFTNTKLMIIIILFTRSLIDPLLNYTKIEIFGQDAGLGAFLNVFSVILFILLYYKSPKKIFKYPASYNWFVFLLTTAVAVVISPYKGSSLSLLLNLTSYMAFYFIALHFAEYGDSKKFWIKILFFSTIPAVFFANIDLLTGGHIYSDAGMRIKGTFTHPNILAFYLIFSFVTTLIYARYSRLTIHKKILITLIAADIFILLLFTKTRSAWIAFFLFSATYSIIKERKYIILLIIFSTILYIIPHTRERITNILNSPHSYQKEKLNSFSWRLELWKSSLSYIKRKPVLGNGLCTFRPYSKNFFPLAGKSGAAAHNIYIKLLFESGIIGLLAYLSIFIAIILSIIKKKNYSKENSYDYYIFLPYLLSYILIGTVDNLLDYLSFNWYFWFLCGIILSKKENS